MTDHTYCPNADELKRLIDGSLPGQRQTECTKHMDTCGCCQARLEEIATSGSDVKELVKGLHADEPLATSAYWPALSALQGAAQQVASAITPPRTRDLSLTFLQPPTDSAYLGRLAHFDVMRVLGRGGMGVVLEAFDSRLQRNVALKVLDPELVEDQTSRMRFCREARAAASITHEHVVAVHQVEKAGDAGLPYLVMQLISGESLDQRLAREKLSVRDVVRIGMQAAQGLAAAHAQGLIHRDIKPGNILLEVPGDRVKLTDFGLARVVEDVRLTHPGFVSGTPLYMSPEQAMGEEADHRSDIFSLGAVLYEMCAGEPPFAGNSSLAILKQIVEVKHRPLRELNPAVPEWLADTIDRLLAKKPENRIQTAAHLAELFEFQWALMKTTSEDVPTVCQIEAQKERRRNLWIAAGIGATFLALGLLGGLYLSERGGAVPAALAASAEPIAVVSANSGAVWSVAFDPHSDTVAMAVEDGSVRLFDWRSGTIKSTINAHRGNIWSARYAPDGLTLATAGDDGLIKLWDTAQPEPLRTFSHRNAVRGLAFAPAGGALFAGDREGNLKLWSLAADQPVAETQQPGTVYAVAVSPDGETLASGGNEKVVRLWNAKTLTQKLPLEGHSGPIYGLAFDATGRRLASTGWDKTVRVWDTASGTLVNSWQGHDGDIWGVAYSPDGKKLATGGTDGALKLWDAESGKLLSTFLGHKTGIHTTSFNHDGSLVASGGRDGAVRIWKVE